MKYLQVLNINQQSIKLWVSVLNVVCHTLNSLKMRQCSEEMTTFYSSDFLLTGALDSSINYAS